MRCNKKIIFINLTTVFLLISASAFAHESSLNQLPWVACEDKNLKDTCEFFNANEDRFRGTCQAMSEVLMCVRNQPIEYATDSKNSSDHDDGHTH